VVGLGLNHFFMWFFTEQVGLLYLISKLISAVLVYLWNFLVRKYALFN
jgi:putative flippase GtrA